MRYFKSLMVSSFLLLNCIGCSNNEESDGAKLKCKEVHTDFKICAYQKLNIENVETISFVISVNFIGSNPIDFSETEYFIANQITEVSSWFFLESNHQTFIPINVLPIQYFGSAPKIDFLVSFSKNEIFKTGAVLSFMPTSKELEILMAKISFSKVIL